MKLGTEQKRRSTVRVAVIDSGWNPGQVHPRVLSGIGLVHPVDEFTLHYSDDYVDRIGHGTACSRIILGIATSVCILPVRVFGHRLEASVEQLVAALQWAAEQRIEVINLSLATLRDDARVPLYAACEEATECGAIIVAAAFPPGERGYPAVFQNAIGVEAGQVPTARAFWYRSDAAVECLASGHPPGRSRDFTTRRRWGTNSFAAARIAGFVAQFRRRVPGAGLDEVREWLSSAAANASSGSGSCGEVAVECRDPLVADEPSD